MKRNVSLLLALLLAASLILTACSGGKDKPTEPAEKITTAAPVSEDEGLVSRPASSGSGRSESDIFDAGTFYMEGVMTSGEDKGVPIKIAISGTSVYLVSGFKVGEQLVEIGILMQNDTKFLIYPISKQYVELNALAMKLIGVDASMLDFGIQSFTGGGSTVTEQGKTKIGLKSVDYEVYTAADNTSIKRYTDGDKLVRIETYTEAGAIQTTIDFDLVTDQIPTGMLEIPGDYEKVSVMKLMNTIISSVTIED